MNIQYCGYCKKQTEFIWIDNFKGKCSECRAPSGFAPDDRCLPGSNEVVQPWATDTHLHDNEEADKKLLMEKSRKYEDPEIVKEEAPVKIVSDLTTRVLDEGLKMGFQIKPEPLDGLSETDRMFLGELLDYGVPEKDANLLIKIVKNGAKKVFNAWKTKRELENKANRPKALDGVFESGSVIIFGEHKDKSDDPSAI